MDFSLNAASKREMRVGPAHEPYLYGYDRETLFLKPYCHAMLCDLEGHDRSDE